MDSLQWSKTNDFNNKCHELIDQVFNKLQKKSLEHLQRKDILDVLTLLFTLMSKPKLFRVCGHLCRFKNHIQNTRSLSLESHFASTQRFWIHSVSAYEFLPLLDLAQPLIHVSQTSLSLIYLYRVFLGRGVRRLVSVSKLNSEVLQGAQVTRMACKVSETK